MGRRLARGMAQWIHAGLWVVLMAPALALVPAMVLDRDAGGRVRASLFSMALTVFDPWVWDAGARAPWSRG